MLRMLLAGVLSLSSPVICGPVVSFTPVPVRIMPLGDSITSGVGAPGRDGYRLELQRHLAAAGLVFDLVGSQHGGAAGDPDHEGHGGWSIEQIAEHAPGWVAAYTPDVVLLHAGTNNITHGEDPAVAAAKLAGLIDRVRAAAPLARLYVSTIVGTGVPGEAAAHRAFNALVADLATSRGPRVRLVEQSHVGGLSLYDAHHPNAHGYARMAHAWYEAMRATIGPDWPAVPDPQDSRLAYLCHVFVVGRCGWWQRRPVPTRAPAGGHHEIRYVDRWTPAVTGNPAWG